MRTQKLQWLQRLLNKASLSFARDGHVTGKIGYDRGDAH